MLGLRPGWWRGLLAVVRSSDTSMVVNAPDGSWYCSDDSGDSIDPMVDFPSPADGLYDIWIGNLDPGTFDDGTLYVTGDASQHP